MRCLAHRAHIGGRHGGGEHDVLVGVFVVGEQHGAAALGPRDFHDVRVVVVVAELLGLRGCSLVVQIEVRRVLEHGVTPADHGLPGEAFRNGERVDGGIHRGDRRELQLRRREALLGGRRQPGAAGNSRFRGGNGAAKYDGERTGGAEAQGGAAGHGGGRNVPEVAVGAGVADVAGAGVVALQGAGYGAALALRMAKHGEQVELAGSRFRQKVPPKLRSGPAHPVSRFRREAVLQVNLVLTREQPGKRL